MADSIDILKIRREEAERELARLLAHVHEATEKGENRVVVEAPEGISSETRHRVCNALNALGVRASCRARVLGRYYVQGYDFRMEW